MLKWIEAVAWFIKKYILLDIDSPENEDILRFLKGSIEDSEKYKTQEDSIQHMKTCVLYTPINMSLEEGEAKKINFTN